ncbi:MAG: peptidylprolyl isomerase [Myxococcales bacterium]|nr:peptidylprolyl isomerase [Myxococcales bacterium]
MTRLAIQPNSHVTLAYTLRSDTGEVLDASDAEGGEPICYVHGYGMIVAGLEAALVGLSAGDRKEIHVAAEDGFGLRDEELVVDIDRSELPDPASVEVGDELVAEDADGDEVVLRVVDVQAESVRVDANHPLAGVALHYSVEIQEVRQATEAEITQAASDLDEVLSEIGAEEEPIPLLQLGKKNDPKLLN